MQYDAQTPAEYMTMLEDDWRREKVEYLRTLIKTTAPQLNEGIEYKMLSFGDEQGNLFHLNAQKSYVSLYVGDASKIDPDGELLTGIDVGKGCLRFRKSVDPAETQVDKFIAQAVEMWQHGRDVAC